MTDFTILNSKNYFIADLNFAFVRRLQVNLLLFEIQFEELTLCYLDFAF